MKIQEQINACEYITKAILVNTEIKNTLESMRDMEDQELRTILYANGLAQLIELTNLNAKLLKIIKNQETDW